MFLLIATLVRKRYQLERMQSLAENKLDHPQESYLG